MPSDTAIRLRFDEADADSAHEEWRCNCGPAALAAVLNLTLDEVRPFVCGAGFGPKSAYMSPTMMKQAIMLAGARRNENVIAGVLIEAMKFPKHGLARIQWEGPWTMPGANPKWAYRHTHWIASFPTVAGSINDAILAALDPILFDVNGGLMRFAVWERDVVPHITKSIPRADGDWHVAHSWEVWR